jgi:alginate O-acetyltransferase complex protein AlgI
MLFNSFEFVFAFLPICWIGYYLLRSRSLSLSNVWITISSLVFYGYWSIDALPLLIASILFNYVTATKIVATDARLPRLNLAIFGIVINVLFLGYFKYLSAIWNGLSELLFPNQPVTYEMSSIVLPIGISFFTFTQIAFLLDCYNKKVKNLEIGNYFFFVTYFPHLLVGPIIHHGPIVSQAIDRTLSKITNRTFALGLTLFICGLAKKILLADPLSQFAHSLDKLMVAGFSPQIQSTWMGTLAYTFQLYFDFSGYTDMAIGISLMFGILLPVNFNSPYKATSIIEFWQRWHMSLTKYFSDYLYTPLATILTRYSLGKPRAIQTMMTMYIPTIIVFTLIGLWHGPSWTFIAFGLVHGFLIASNHWWRGKIRSYSVERKQRSRLSLILGWAATFLTVHLSLVLFKAKSLEDAWKVYQGMFGVNGISLPRAVGSVLNLPEIYIGNMWQSHFIQQNTPSTFLFLGYIVVSLFIILFLPSTTSFMALNREDRTGTLLDSSGGKFRWLAFKRDNYVLILVLGILLGLSLSNLGKNSEFLYFNF